MSDVCRHAHARITIRSKISDTDSWGDCTIGQLKLAAVNKMQATSSRTPQKFRLGRVEFEAVRCHPFRYVTDASNDSGFYFKRPFQPFTQDRMSHRVEHGRKIE